MTAVKICGLSDESGARAAISAQADYVGFVHFPASPRHITFERAAELKQLLPPSLKSVSVLVNPDDALLAQAQTILKPDYVQLHGKESPERILAIKRIFHGKIIKAIAIRSSEDVAQAADFMDAVDILLFDAKPPESPGMLPGGNARPFDWILLAGWKFTLPWFLSGGLNPENVAEAIRISGAEMVDVSSGVESAPGVKDPALIAAFVKAARHET